MAVSDTKPVSPSKMPTRREFNIALGTVAGAAILGYFLVRQKDTLLQPDREAGERPRLKDGVAFHGPDESGYAAIRLANGNVCAVNPAGTEILRQLNGEQTIHQIAAALARREGIDSGATLEAKVACFLAELGMLGFLEAPYYANIVDAVEV